MARFQIQSRPESGREWRDEPTCVYSRRSYNTAIASAKVVVTSGRAFGPPVLVRIIRVGRWTGNFKEVVWLS